jgi:hypothetical protein
VITGISSTFSTDGQGTVIITVTVVSGALDGLVYDLEIFYNEQTPPWQVAQPASWPAGWGPLGVTGGVGFVTETSPLAASQPGRFVLVVPPAMTIGNTILIHVTDRNHNNLGYITSQRVT